MDKSIIKAKFFNSLKRGTGEAILIAEKNPKIDFSYYIVKAASKNYSYDGQSEGDRAKYIFDLINLSSQKEKIRKSVIKNLLSEKNDFWGLVQLFEIAKMFTEQGHKDARQAIYKRFLTHVIKGGDWAGYRQILDLDGLNGLFYISEKYGKLIAKKPDYIDDCWIVNDFGEENPGVDVYKQLNNAAKTNKYIRIYLDTIMKSEAQGLNHQNTPQYKDVFDEIFGVPRYLSPKRIKSLKKSDMKKIALALIKEKDVQRIEKYLYVFRYRKFPLDSEFILSLAKNRSKTESRIKEFAYDALVFLKSDNIRNFAIERMLKTRTPETFTRILVSNFKSGDGKRLAEISQKIKNHDQIHVLGHSFYDIFTSNSTKECKKPLENIYNNLTCGVCRYDIIKLLLKNNVLSKRIKNEIRYDSYEDTRKLWQSRFNN